MPVTPQQLAPLSDARYREINTAQGMILQVRDLIAKAKKCGVDTTEDEIYFDAAEANFNEWKAQFFPTKP